MRNFVFTLFIISVFSCEKDYDKKKDFTTLFETSKGTQTPEYKDVISYYKELSEEYASISLFSFGQTDSGKPLHLVVYDRAGVYNIAEIKSQWLILENLNDPE